MIILALNCRGLGRAAALRSLKYTTKSHMPDVIFLSEIKTSKDTKIKSFISALGFQNYHLVPPIGKSGGLILVWRNTVKLQIKRSSQNFINAMISPDPPDPPWQFTGVYGPTKYALKSYFWGCLDTFAQDFTGPSLFIGDFNSVLSQADKTGGKPFVSSSSGGLQGVINNNGLIDLGFNGPAHTWSNRRGGQSNIRERLDRGLANGSWNLLFPKASVCHLAAETSDHAPLLLKTSAHTKFRARPFRFEAMWARDATCESVIQDAWACRTGNNATYMLLSALMSVQKELKIWNKKQFGHCQKLVDVIRDKLLDIQRRPHSDALLQMETKLQEELEENLLRLEIMWRQKSRDNWLKEGDANTHFFHLSTIIHRRYNAVLRIKSPENVWLSEPEDIDQCFVNFFKELFQSVEPDYPDNLYELIPSTLTIENNQRLCATPTETEVHDIVWSMGAQKSPGPDGLPPFFYKTYWEIVKNEVVSCVRHFFDSRIMGEGMNHTYISLIKKVDKPTEPSQFRPIALCNVAYKIISKLLANRLKGFLEGIIAVNQSAFIPGRQISENSIVSQEIMHYLQRHKGKTGYMAIKLDMEKAYDKVEWSLLAVIMHKHGFDPHFIELVSQCISTASFSTLVNGIPSGNFTSTRGIRQGDPISPYLFILYFDLLSRMIHKAESEGLLKGIKICRNAPPINHLLYADDLVIYCRATTEDAETVSKILEVFEGWSGLKVSKPKSFIHYGKNVDLNIKQNIGHILGLKECMHKERHLGLPFCKGRTRNADFEFIIEKVKQRLSGWKGKLLSQASRSVLIKSVLQAAPSYSMQTFALPVNICDKIDSMNRKFFWGAGEDKQHFLALIAWDKITLPKFAGGLGFRKMVDQNRAFNTKLAWQMLKYDEKLWSSLLAKKYLKRMSILDIKNHPPDSSRSWQAICKSIEMLASNTCFTIGDGSCISIWDKEWIPTLPGFKPPVEFRKEDSPLLVSDLFTPSNSWNIQLLQDMFPPDVCNEITKISIPPPQEPIAPIWLPSKSGQFTVKSAYLTVINRRLNPNQSIVKTVWKKVWNSRLHGRYKHLLWRVMNNGMPVKERLRFLPTTNDHLCVLCKSQGESMEHLFLNCHVIRSVLFRSKWNFRINNNISSMVEWMQRLLDPSNAQNLGGMLREEFLNFVMTAFDQIWKLRNKVVFEGATCDVNELSNAICKAADDHWEAQLKKLINMRHNTTDLEWKPPRKGWIKVNCDASLVQGKSCAAWLARNHKGNTVGALARSYQTISVDEAEARAVTEAIEACTRMGATNLIFESDSSTVITDILSLKSGADRLTKHLIDRIKNCCNGRNDIVMRKIPRLCNMAAHNLALWANTRNWDGPIPLNVIPTTVFCDQGSSRFEIEPGIFNLYN